MIIPQVEANLNPNKGLGEGDVNVIPETCPCCHTKLTFSISAGDVQQVFCPNYDCLDRKVREIEHFVSKKALDVKGLSENTIRKFMEIGVLKRKQSIFDIQHHKDTIIQMDGFGEKAFNKLVESIETARCTTHERFIIALDIPDVGRHASAIIAKGSSPISVGNNRVKKQ